MNGPTTSQTPPCLDTNTPIANIPDDVLFDIVHLVIEMSDHLTRRLLRTQRSWLSITQVCTYWRSLITNNPAFWTNLKFRAFFNRQLAAAFLRRAENRLIDLRYQGSGNPPNRDPLLIASFIDSHTSRIKGLSIVQLDHEETEVMLRRLCTPALRLQTLEISAVRRRTVLYPIFTGILPALQDFRMTGLCTALPQSSSMRVLILESSHMMRSFGWILECLHEMPFLEVLHVNQLTQYPYTLPQDPTHILPVQLARLKSFAWTSWIPKDLTAVLEYIVFPPTANVKLHFCYLSIPLTIALHDKSVSLQTIASRVPAAILIVSKDPKYATAILQSADHQLELQWSWREGQPGAASARPFERITFNALLFLSLRQLSVHSLRRELKETDWANILESLYSLETLDVGANVMTVRHLGAALSPSDHAVTSSVYLCVQLKHLKIVHLQRGERCLHELLSSLMRRSRVGLKLRSLALALPKDGELVSHPQSILRAIADEVKVQYHTLHPQRYSWQPTS